MACRESRPTVAQLLDPSTASPSPGRSLERYSTGSAEIPPDPVIAQLEDTQLRGDSFRTEKIDKLIDEGHVLIGTFNRPSLLFDLRRDRREEKNLADSPEHTERLRRMRETLEQVATGIETPVLAHAL